MSNFQKVIKYCAIGFACFLAVSIIGGIISLILFFGSFFGLDNEKSRDVEVIFSDQNSSISYLDIDVNSVNLNIESGDSLSVSSNSKYISYKTEDNNKLIIKEKKHFRKFNKNNVLTIIIPKKKEFDKVSIETGAGKAIIDSIIIKELNFDFGAGQVVISDLVVSDNTNIESGAGQIIIKNSTLANLDLDMGVGQFNLNAKLIGQTSIEQGVGSLNIQLLDSLDNYKIRISKGLGSVSLNGNQLGNDTITGNGKNTIDIDGGVGSINITTND